MPPREYTGLAQICFLDNWFQAHLIPSSSSSHTPLSIVGTPAPSYMHPPPHPCCTPTPFWLLKIVDWDYDEEAEIVVQQRGGEGDVVEFSSVFVGCEDDGLIHDQEGALEFATSLVKVEEDAEQHMKRYFPQLTATDTATICLGQMEIRDLDFQRREALDDDNNDDHGNVIGWGRDIDDSESEDGSGCDEEIRYGSVQFTVNIDGSEIISDLPRDELREDEDMEDTLETEESFEDIGLPVRDEIVMH